MTHFWKQEKRFHKFAHTNILIRWKSTKWFSLQNYIQSVRLHLKKKTFLSLGDLKMNGNVKIWYFYNHHTVKLWGSKILCEARYTDAAQDARVPPSDKCSWLQNACKSKEKWNCLTMVLRHYIRISNPFTVLQTQKKLVKRFLKTYLLQGLCSQYRMNVGESCRLKFLIAEVHMFLVQQLLMHKGGKRGVLNPLLLTSLCPRSHVFVVSVFCHHRKNA